MTDPLLVRTEPFGIDLSSHNDRIDENKIKAYSPKISFAWVRSGESWGYEDPKFSTFRAQLTNVVEWIGAYHVLYPGENAKNQAQKMISIAGKSMRGYAVDVELIHSQSPSTIREACRVFVSEILNAGLDAWLYTSPKWFTSYVIPFPQSVPDWFKSVKWWLAQYLTSGVEHPGPVSLPRGVTKDLVYIHQTTSSLSGALIGQPVTSPKLDGNRAIQMMPGLSTPPAEPTDAEKLARLWDAHPEIH